MGGRKDRISRAVALFGEGANCCQAVLAVYGPLYGLDREQCLRLGLGMGAGVGGQGEVCGAVNGAALVLSLRAGTECDPLRRESKQTAKDNVALFAGRFRELRGALACRDLLGLDLSTPEGYGKARSEGLFRKVCPEIVRDAAAALEEVLGLGDN